MVIKSWGRRERFNTPRECIEAQLKACGIVRCYYSFHGPDSISNAHESTWGEMATPEEMLELAVEQFNNYGTVAFNGVSKNNAIYYLGCWDYACEIRYPGEKVATIKEVNKELRLYKLLDYCEEGSSKSKTSEEEEIFDNRAYKIREAISDLRTRYNWRDEMFHENGLVGLRTILGKMLVPCGEYDYIKGCAYGNDTTLAIAVKDGKFGLIKRDGKGTVVFPFKYFLIGQLIYDKSEVEPDKAYDIFYGEYEDPDKGKDLIVDGQIVVKNASFTGGIDDRIYRGGITYQKEGKYGFLGIYWDWCLIDPIFDKITHHEQPPVLTFVKNGTEGILTMDKEFIPLDTWNSLTKEQQNEQEDNVIGYYNSRTYYTRWIENEMVLSTTDI